MTTKNVKDRIVQERNHFIDLLRGLCLIGVLWHHTCLYSGGDFVPKFMKQISFFLEVPALFFVSGLTYQYIKREIIINNILKLSLSFTLISVILNGIFGELTFERIITPLFLCNLELPTYFSVLAGSYWFVTYYVLVIIASAVLIKGIRGIYPLVMFLLFVGSAIVYLGYFSFHSFLIWHLITQKFLLCWFFFLFGYWCGEYILNTTVQKKFAQVLSLFVAILLCGAYWYEDSSVTNIWYQKDISGFPYLLVSMWAIIGFIWFYSPRRENHLLERIGRNAVFYYIGQGLSCSFLVLLEPRIQLIWGIKLLLLFIVNFILMVVCSEIFKLIYGLCGKVYKRFFGVNNQPLKPVATT